MQAFFIIQGESHGIILHKMKIYKKILLLQVNHIQNRINAKF